MDKIFTFPQMLIKAREISVVVVGTKKEIIGSPPKDINNIHHRQFNTIHRKNNKRNFQIQPCIENNVFT